MGHTFRQSGALYCIIGRFLYVGINWCHFNSTALLFLPIIIKFTLNVFFQCQWLSKPLVYPDPFYKLLLLLLLLLQNTKNNISTFNWLELGIWKILPLTLQCTVYILSKAHSQNLIFGLEVLATYPGCWQRGKFCKGWGWPNRSSNPRNIYTSVPLGLVTFSMSAGKIYHNAMSLHCV